MPRRKFEALLSQGSKVDEREVIALRNKYLVQIGKLAAKDAAAPLLNKAGELFYCYFGRLRPGANAARFSTQSAFLSVPTTHIVRIYGGVTLNKRAPTIRLRRSSGKRFHFLQLFFVFHSLPQRTSSFSLIRLGITTGCTLLRSVPSEIAVDSPPACSSKITNPGDAHG